MSSSQNAIIAAKDISTSHSAGLSRRSIKLDLFSSQVVNQICHRNQPSQPSTVIILAPLFLSLKTNRLVFVSFLSSRGEDKLFVEILPYDFLRNALLNLSSFSVAPNRDFLRAWHIQRV
jgi:hypothetical protein